MISATALAWALPGVARCSCSWPAVARFNEALNVAKRTVLPGGDGVAATAGGVIRAAVMAAAASVEHARNALRVRVIAVLPGPVRSPI